VSLSSTKQTEKRDIGMDFGVSVALLRQFHRKKEKEKEKKKKKLQADPLTFVDLSHCFSFPLKIPDTLSFTPLYITTSSTH
jgi:hypothetical protein